MPTERTEEITNETQRLEALRLIADELHALMLMEFDSSPEEEVAKQSILLEIANTTEDFAEDMDLNGP